MCLNIEDNIEDWDDFNDDEQPAYTPDDDLDDFDSSDAEYLAWERQTRRAESGYAD